MTTTTTTTTMTTAATAATATTSQPLPTLFTALHHYRFSPVHTLVLTAA
jgi:hypothetical protein